MTKKLYDIDAYAREFEATVLFCVQQETGYVFAQVLEHAGVYKRTEEGKAAFMKFIESVRQEPPFKSH